MSPARFCVRCGAATSRTVPEGDDRKRDVCPRCGHVHYHNPKVVVGCLPVHEGRVLLCRRAIEPRHGYWTLPSGFLEAGETVEDGAARETWEEACARVAIDRLFAVFSISHVDQVYLLFLARLLEPERGANGEAPPRFAPGAETLETRLAAPEEIPWERIAFRAVEFALQRWVGADPDDPRVHLGSYARGPGDAWIAGHRD